MSGAIAANIAYSRRASRTSSAAVAAGSASRRNSERRQSLLRARRNRERDFRCQFLAAAVMGAVGAVCGCSGIGLILYGLPTPQRLADETREMDREEAIAMQVRLMLYGRLGGLLLGLGIFLLIVLAVIGSDFKQHRDRTRPRDDSRAALNRRLYADILRGLRLVDVAEQEADDDEGTVEGADGVAVATTPRTPTIAAVVVSQAAAIVRPSRASSLRLLREKNKRQPLDTTAAGGGSSVVCGSQLLGPTWRANEAFDASDEFTTAARRPICHSAQSTRRRPTATAEATAATTAAAATDSAASLQQLFSVEREFQRLRRMQVAPAPSSVSELQLEEIADCSGSGEIKSGGGGAERSKEPPTRGKMKAEVEAAPFEVDGEPEY